MFKKERSRTRMAALLLATGLVAAACGTDTTVDADAAADAAAEATGATEADSADESSDAAGDSALTVNFEGLEPLGEGFVYEGWVVVDDAPVSTGRFVLDADGNQEVVAEADFGDISAASAYILTVEPAENDDPAPADVKLLAGDIVDGEAALTIDHPAALGTDYAEAAGQFIVATPSSESTDDEYSGVWFIEIVDGAPAQGLEVPVLPAGWVYEGWVVIDGEPFSTGRFTDPGAPDDFAGYSGEAGTPPFPGEDFVANAPEGFEFPTDVRGSDVVLSIEPEVDDSPAPFVLKPLATTIPADVESGTGIELGAGPAFPTGTATLG